MKQRIILVLSLLVLIVLMLSCATSHDYHLEISCDAFMENPKGLQKNYQMEIGDKIYIELCSNPTTGFKWAYELIGDVALKERGYEFKAPEDALPGAAGKEIWAFVALEKGTTVISMEYSQPWEGGIKREWAFKADVTVE